MENAVSLVLLSLALAASPASQASAHGLCSSRPKAVVSIDELRVPRVDLRESIYYDLYARCTSITRVLRGALSRSSRYYSSGDIQRASQHLLITLRSVAQDVGVQPYSVPPHTLLAVSEGYYLAKEYMAVADDGRDSGPQTVGRDIALYDFLVKTYATIQWAYTNLDQRYFNQYVRQCVIGRYCYNRSSNVHALFDRDYFNNVRDLAMKFLYLLADTAPKVANDVFELKLTTLAANAAARILNQSVYRRDYACDILDLLDIADEAGSQVCGGSDGDRVVSVDIVREGITNVYLSLSGRQPEQYFCHGRRH